MSEKPEPRSGWRERMAALRQVPTVLGFVWESGRAVVILGVAARVVAALLPPALFWVSKLIVDAIFGILTKHQPVGSRLWWLVALEFALAIVAGLIGRLIDYLDALLAGKYTHYISIRVMEHAAGLDLLAYEDPVFYDRLERARVQATDRLYMIQAIGRLIQQAITTITLSISIMVFSPWLLLLLVVGVIPAFVGETHFAFLGYAKNFRQTPVRRQLDYLRTLGGSKEAAKELKLFGLRKFLTNRFRILSSRVYEEDIALARRKAVSGSFLSAIGTAGYYTAYVFAVWKTVTGVFTFGTLTLLANAIREASSNLQQTFSTLSTIADQALFLTDLVAFFEMQPKVTSKPNALPAPRPIMRGFEFRDVSFRYPGSSRLVLQGFNFHLRPEERIALIGENGEGKTTIVKLLTRLYDPAEGQILLDGIDLREYDLEDLYREIGVIFQDFMRYEMTARENIGVGLIDQVGNLPRLVESARKSLAHDVVQRLPFGYEQMLGEGLMVESISPVANGKNSRWPGLICETRKCSFWMSLPRRSMRAANTKSFNGLPN
jgi:ATP-binding cassette subfamily B protein